MFSFDAASIVSCLRTDAVQRILSAALRAADPADAVRRAAARVSDALDVRGQHYDLSGAGRVHVLAAGKAATGMAQAILPLVEDHLAGGLVVTKHASRGTLGRLVVMEAGHPLPDERSLRAGRCVLDLLGQLRADDLLVCLISGGASALVIAPRDGVTLDEIQKTTSNLMRSGASIFELNEARQKLDRLKGGGLARLAYPARVVSLILSDVIGDRIDIIASGPTAPREGESFDHVQNAIIGSNAQSAEAAREHASREGFHARVLTTSLHGEAREAGRMLAGELRQSSPRPLCLLAGGETTVTVTGDGLGGRNQELALAAALDMDGLENVLLVSLATDGDDGTTGAAGAAVNGQTLSRARALGLDAADFLRRNDSYHFFAPLNDLLVTGPTGTNVNDLVFLFAFQ
ncbi:MAG: DUF4147 domain-containing protein [Chloroflexota bacterium]